MLTSRISARLLVVFLIASSMSYLWPIRLPASETPPHVGTSAATIPDSQERSRLADQWHKADAEAKSQLWTGMLAAQADATPNQSLWDVVSYDLALTVDPMAQTLQGVVGCTAVVTTTEPLATLDLDLADGMTVSSVTSDGVPAAFTHASDLLSITLDRVYSQSDTVRVVATYQGNPAGDAFSWSEYDSQPLIWTLSEPYGARTWWPCKDTPDDKADTIDLRVTVPDGLIAASNGALLSDSVNGGWRTYHWQETHPIATYLVSLAIHPYTVLEDIWEYAPGQTMPVVQYVMSDRMPQISEVLEATIPMLQVLSDGFGLYPFTDEKYGHACFDWGGGMEHQTLCSLYYGVTTNWHFLIVHELAHQWWGDLVTCASFHHIWLNEGFATWSEAYWYEQTEGEAAYHQDMASKAYYGPGTIYVADPTDVHIIFDHDLTYDKASWVVHMLRGVLGDEDFFAVLQAWRQQFAYRSATTADFQQVCEQIWGGDLSWFFQEWIYGQYFPRYDTRWYARSAGDSTEVEIMIRQTQQNLGGLFTMPLTIRVVTDQATWDRRLWNDSEAQLYQLTVAGTVQDVVLDPDNWVLQQSTCSMTDVPSTSAPPYTMRAWPNPFNPSTTISFELPASGPVELAVYDVKGRRVRILVSARREAGSHEVAWDGRDERGRRLPSGIYFCRLETMRGLLTRKVTLVE